MLTQVWQLRVDVSSVKKFRFVSGGLTSGGGSPPAPAGQSGSIFFLPSQLQKQAGDGSSMVQFVERKSCWTLSGTSGVCQSSSPIVQGASLRDRKVINDHTCNWLTIKDTGSNSKNMSPVKKKYHFHRPNDERMHKIGMNMFKSDHRLCVWTRILHII